MSSYGLKGQQLEAHLKKRPRLNLPPFRDSYQTSVFLATQRAAKHSLAALRPAYEETDWCKQSGECNELRRNLARKFATAKAFEVGRSMLVPLDENEQLKFRKQFQPISLGRSMLAAVVAGSGVLLLCAFLSVHFNRRQVWRFVRMAACLILVPLLLTVVVYIADAFDGEPLPLGGGANMLPTLALLVLIPILAMFFLTKSQVDLNLNRQRLLHNFNLLGNEVWAERLLSHTYGARQEGLSRHWIRFRMYYLCAAHLFFSVALIMAFGDFSPPIRGEVTFWAYHIAAIATLLGFFVLVYSSVAEIQQCQDLTCGLMFARLDWSEQTLKTFARRRNITLYPRGSVRDGLVRWIGIQVLAQKTLASEKVVYYPFIVLLLLFLAHSRLFDNWRLFVPSIIIALASGALVIATCVLRLRFSVKKVRESALSSMKTALFQDLQEGEQGDIQSFRLMVGEIEHEQRGAFRPVFSDPIFKALLMPLGGYGSLFLIDYLTRFLQG